MIHRHKAVIDGIVYILFILIIFIFHTKLMEVININIEQTAQLQAQNEQIKAQIAQGVRRDKLIEAFATNKEGRLKTLELYFCEKNPDYDGCETLYDKD